jgi:pyruvate,water dikinase
MDADHSTGGRVHLSDLNLSPQQRLLIRPIYQKARSFRFYREAISFLYTYGYGLFRVFFLALARRWTARRLLAEPEDIFFLTHAEIQAAVHGGSVDRATIARRQVDLERHRAIVPPAIVYGDIPPPVDADIREKLHGTPTSRGHHTGPARVVRGIADFPKVRPGDVLVIPYSDVGWTPLFAKASAVIAESGGILSHSSIVAREYNIPAVVSVPGACLLPEGSIVTVDGHTGEILVHRSPPEEELP